MSSKFDQIISHFTERKLLLLSDDYSDNEETVLISIGLDLSEDTLNEILTIARGPLQLVLGAERVTSFGLTKMSSSRLFALNPDQEVQAQCVSVEAREGVASGISVADRCHTIRILSEQIPDRRKIVSPGHIVPVEGRAGGVLVRHSLREAALDLVKAVGATDSAIVVDCLNKSGEILSATEVNKLSETHKISKVTLGEIIRWRLESERIVKRIATAKIPTTFGDGFRAIMYQSEIDGGEHIALVKGEISSEKPVLTRVHVENSFEDVFGGEGKSRRRSMIRDSMEAISEAGVGILVYLRRNINKSSALSFQPKAYRMKEYGLGAQILLDLGVKKIVLLTNTKNNLVGLTSFGIEIVATEELNKAVGEKRI